MNTIYLLFILFLFGLAIVDLMVGVSNDAVNFLNSAIGAKVAKFRTVIIIAAAGVFFGALMSNGMMDIARHGICQPAHFTFSEMMCIFLAVMTTDVVLLDVFNTLGLPTSTTVSLVFELLGGTFALATIKVLHGGVYTELLNTNKALSVILGIFVSVAIAFVAGLLVQFVVRLIFSFGYKKALNRFGGIFAGLACAVLGYFIFLKGVAKAPFVPASVKDFIDANITLLSLGSFVFFSVLMHVLHCLGVNILKLVVLLGTFALAMAFAGNDLVNFIGVPLAGFSAWQDFAANGAGADSSYLMGSLQSSARTPVFFLLAAAVVMVYSLVTSRKAQNVVKTSVDLSRQDEGEEMFGSSRAARGLVRFGVGVSEFSRAVSPVTLRRWVNSRFESSAIITERGAAFDLVRAAVNLVLAALLIIIGTNLKLPLSTTYVTFIVAMSTSLADRAWSRESAVFRVTGMLSVIGGWFITALAAFLAAALVCLAMHAGGFLVMVALCALAAFLLVKSNFTAKERVDLSEEDTVFRQLIETRDAAESLALLRRHVVLGRLESVDFIGGKFEGLVAAFESDELSGVKDAMRAVRSRKEAMRRLRARDLAGLRRLDRGTSVLLATWLHLGVNCVSRLHHGLRRMGDPIEEHLANNFNRLPRECAIEFRPIKRRVADLFLDAHRLIESGNFTNAEAFDKDAKSAIREIDLVRPAELERLRTDAGRMRVHTVYLNLLQETSELIDALRDLVRACANFQADINRS